MSPSCTSPTRPPGALGAGGPALPDEPPAPPAESPPAVGVPKRGPPKPLPPFWSSLEKTVCPGLVGAGRSVAGGGKLGDSPTHAAKRSAGRAPRVSRRL